MTDGYFYDPPGRGVATGRGIGDFDFLVGEWRIHNRRLKDGTTDIWEEFPGAATVHRVMGGKRASRNCASRPTSFAAWESGFGVPRKANGPTIRPAAMTAWSMRRSLAPLSMERAYSCPRSRPMVQQISIAAYGTGSRRRVAAGISPVRPTAARAGTGAGG